MRTPKQVRNDASLREAVMAEIEWDPMIDPARIHVAAHDGAIALTGFVSTLPQKSAAVRAAERVYGVEAVADDLQVKLPESVERDDAAIAQAIARERAWNMLIPESIDAEVGKGRVTLRGRVDREYQREEAGRAVSRLAGVRQVTNLIRVSTAAAPDAADLEQRIEDALTRMADLDARAIRVTTSDGTVRLHGTVHSLAESRAAERAARSAPGVTDVENDLFVAP